MYHAPFSTTFPCNLCQVQEYKDKAGHSPRPQPRLTKLVLKPKPRTSILGLSWSLRYLTASAMVVACSMKKITTDLESKQSKQRFLTRTTSSLSLHRLPRYAAPTPPTGIAAQRGYRLPVWSINRCPWCPDEVRQTGYDDFWFACR